MNILFYTIYNTLIVLTHDRLYCLFTSDFTTGTLSEHGDSLNCLDFVVPRSQNQLALSAN